jgi:hypothetical protein
VGVARHMCAAAAAVVAFVHRLQDAVGAGFDAEFQAVTARRGQLGELRGGERLVRTQPPRQRSFQPRAAIPRRFPPATAAGR